MIQYAELLSMPAPPADKREPYGDGPLQFGELRLPRNAPGQRPIVVFIHGGCWQAEYNLTHVAPAAAALAEAGYAVWVPEYRRLGDTGGGWPGTFEDVANAVDHVRALRVLLAASSPVIDTTRVILAGHSAGGQLALWAASRRADENVPGLAASNAPLAVAGVVGLAAITDLIASGAAPGGCNSSVSPLLGGRAAEFGARYRAVSPIERLPLGAPVHLVHGASDPIVPVAMSEQYAARARAAGDRIDVSVVPGAGHFDVVAPGTAAWAAVLAAVNKISTAK